MELGKMVNRTELKRAYKETRREMGVYQIKNIQNGKTLVAASRNLRASMNGKKFELRHGSHFNKELQEEWNRYGESSFTFEVLEILKPREDAPADYLYREELRALEDKWLAKLQPFGRKGYHK
jgi:hypothetical protein